MQHSWEQRTLVQANCLQTNALHWSATASCAVLCGVDTHGSPLLVLLVVAAVLCEHFGLQVYEGVAAMHSRDFKRAAELLLDSIATFTT
jgi:hypothetical protein